MPSQSENPGGSDGAIYFRVRVTGDALGRVKVDQIMSTTAPEFLLKL